jgi:hypothetical protein
MSVLASVENPYLKPYTVLASVENKGCDQHEQEGMNESGCMPLRWE